MPSPNAIALHRSLALSCFVDPIARGDDGREYDYDPEEILRFLEAWAKQKTPNGMKHGRNAHGVESYHNLNRGVHLVEVRVFPAKQS